MFAGSASLNASTNGKIAIRTLSYFLVTSLFNAVLGVVLVLLVHPGDPSFKPINLGTEIAERKNTLLDNFLDLGRNIVPANIFSTMFQQVDLNSYLKWYSYKCVMPINNRNLDISDTNRIRRVNRARSS